MKDFDFDELDKAVSSVLGDADDDQTPVNVSVGTPASTPEPTQNKEEPATVSRTSSVSSHALHSRLMPGRSHSTVTLGKHASSEVAPVEDTVSENMKPNAVVSGDNSEAAKSETPEETSAPVAKHRNVLPHRAGRFMDVVHPSSDMKRRNAPVVASKAVVSPTPVAPVVDDEVPVEAALESVTLETDMPSTVEVPAPKVVNTDLEHAINQLLADEKTGDTTTAPSPPEETSAPEETQVVEPEVAESTQDTMETSAPADALIETPTPETLPEIEETPEISQSPFLSDAKVDKRPLGNQSIIDTPADIPEPAVPTPMSAGETPAPPELASDIMALESVEVATEEAVEVPTVSEPRTEELPAETSAPIEMADSEVEVATDASTSDDKPEYSGPTSIPRQYKVEPRKGDEDDDTTAIFDTESYHQPIEHPPKKSYKWLWITIVLLIVAAIAGAGVYFWLSGAFVVLK